MWLNRVSRLSERMTNEAIRDKLGETVPVIEAEEKLHRTNRKQEDERHHKTTTRKISKKGRRQKQVLLQRALVGKVEEKVNHVNSLEQKNRTKMTELLRIVLLITLRSTLSHQRVRSQRERPAMATKQWIG